MVVRALVTPHARTVMVRPSTIMAGPRSVVSRTTALRSLDNRWITNAAKTYIARPMIPLRRHDFTRLEYCRAGDSVCH